MPTPFYLLHPTARYLPGVDEWIDDVEVVMKSDPAWANWKLIPISYDDQNGFVAATINGRVRSDVGPVLLLEKVQVPAREILREHLRLTAIVSVQAVYDSAELLAAMEVGRDRHDSGEPFLPRKLVVAILILRKLVKGDYWGGGAKNKAFAYADDLAKGRGVDDQFKDIAREVANDLKSKGLLIGKPSGGRAKYALNPKRRSEIMNAAESSFFEDEEIYRMLTRDLNEISVRHLDP